MARVDVEKKKNLKRKAVEATLPIKKASFIANNKDLLQQGGELLLSKGKNAAKEVGDQLISHGKKELEKVGNQLLEKGKQKAIETGKGLLSHAGKAASNFLGGVF